MYLLMNFHFKGKKCDIFPSNIAWSMFLVSFIFTAKMLNVYMLQLVEKILSTFYILLNEIKIYTRRGLVYYLLKDFCYTWAFFLWRLQVNLTPSLLNLKLAGGNVVYAPCAFRPGICADWSRSALFIKQSVSI